MKTLKGGFFRLTSILLCIAMLLVFMPQAILAEAADLFKGENMPECVSTEGSENIPEAYILGEVIDERTLNTKTFRMSDGSFVLADYNEPIHFEDKNGELVEYDNTLTYSDAGSNEDDFAGYETAVSDIKIKFANNSNSNNLVKLQTGEYKISLHLVGANKSKKAEITNTSDALEGDDIDSSTTLTKFSSGVVYEEILKNTDMQYIINGGNLKENIIVKEKSDEYEYTFELKLKGIVPTLNEDGDIVLKDENTDESVLFIPAGYMYDADGKFSSDVHYAIEHKNGKKYTLTVTADANWINADDRAFPVVIDPTFNAAHTGLDTLDTYVSEADPSKNYYLLTTMKAGYQNGYANEVLIQADHLNAIPKSAVIVRSYYNFRVSSAVAGDRTDGIKTVIKAFPVTSSWDSSTAKWNNKPTYSDEALDYIAYYSNKSYGYVSYDITRLVQKWYTGTPNNGIVLKSDDTSDGYVIFHSSDNSVSTSYKPKLVIEYRDTKGLDSRWTFAAQSAGSAGSGYVNGFNGNLVLIHDDFSTKGSILPITVSHVFNSANAGEEFSSAMPVGLGWKLSIQETIRSTAINSATWYIYNDSDGTDLYFYYNSSIGKYVSEDGLGLTLTLGSGNSKYTLTDDYGNKKNFNTSGNIASVVDVNGNKKTFEYTNGKITKITYTKAGSSTAVEQLKFDYYTNGAIKTITDAVDDSDYVTFKYSGTYNGSYSTSANTGFLRSINYSKGGGCMYSYSSAGNLTTLWDIDTDSNINYSYLSTSYTSVDDTTITVYKVSQVSESGYDTDLVYWPTGQTVRFTYGDKKFTARTSGKDDIINNTDDILTTYIFDNEGRVICSYSSDINDQYIYGTTYNEYTATTTGSKKNSKVTVDSAKGANSFNYVVNGNLESTSGWISDTSGTGYSSAITSADKFLGNYSMKLASTSGGTGYARRYATVDLPTNGTFTLSAYVKIDSITASSGGGAYIVFDGKESERITATSSSDIQNGWRRISVTKDFSVGGEKTIQLRLANATGSVYFDCVQVEMGEAPSGFNAVQNGHMDLQAYWNYGSTYELDIWRIGYTKKVIGNANAHNYASQTVRLSVPEDTTLMLSGWGKAVSAPTGKDINDNNRTFRIVANVHYTDGTVDDQAADFNTDYTDWQYTSTAIIPAENDEGERKSISYIVIYLSYDFNINEAYFDDVCLTVEPAQTYKYDDNGNIQSTKDALGNTTGAVYNNVDLTDLTTPVGLDYDYTYNSKHQLLTATKTENDRTQTATYGYDSYGNTTSAVLSAADRTDTISSSAAYSADGNFLSSVTDQLGGTTTYSRDSVTKLLNYIQNANANRTAYIYDSRYRTSKIYNDRDKDGVIDSNEEYVEYLYSWLGRLEKINTDTSAYTFEYDPYGNISRIKAGSNTLATYSYGPNNGKLKKLTYGNGAYEEYTYDHLDRIKSVKYNGDSSKTYTITYSNDGSIYCITDNVAGIKYIYEYDSLGRLIRGEQKKLSDNSTAISIENRFDEYGRSSGGSYELGSKTLSYGIDYNENSNQIYHIAFPDQSSNYYSYDSFDRLLIKKYHDLAYYSTYRYYEPADNSTSSLVRYLITSYRGGRVAHEYEYDLMGNITSVNRSGSINSYEYDSLGQLVRENNADAGKSYKYAYDRAGNITTRDVYDYTTGPLPIACQSFDFYDYSAGQWGDLLTTFNGTDITYDAIGNPLNWRNATTLEWNGRKLTKQTLSSDKALTYSYNSDGIRTEKRLTDSSISQYYSHNYTLDGSRIVYEKYMIVGIGGHAEHNLYYYYDESGVCGFEYNGTPYYFLKNIQGDVISILNASGQLVVSYTYDAWGKVLSTAGTLASTVGQINPFRYRGYYYDTETGFYYVSSRYYDPEVGRWISADNQLSTGSDMTGMNLFAYCGNNPVNRIDPTGEAWWHWALGAAVVAACAVATVVSCGGFAAAATAVCMVGNGVAAATTASTVAAGAFISSATVYGTAVLSAASTSSSVQEFNDQGNWDTVVATTGAAVLGGYSGYTMSKAQTPTTTGKGTQNPKVKAAVQKGQAMHKQMDYGPGVVKEKKIAPGCRVDGIDYDNHIIYELKPNNPRAIARGKSQLNKYTAAARQQYGGTWIGVLKLYDQR